MFETKASMYDSINLGHVLRDHREDVINNIQDVIDDLWRGGQGWILVTISAGWFLSLGVRVIFPAILPFLRSEFGLSLTISGFLLTVLWAAYAVGQFPGGIFGDRYGEGNMLVFSTIASGVAILLVALSVSIEMLFFATVIFGFSTALFGPIRYTIFTDIYTKRAGTAVGITMSAGNIGNAILPIIAVFLAGFATWRMSFGITAPLFFLVGILLYWFVPSSTSKSDALINEFSRKSLQQLFQGIRRPDILGFAFIQVLLGFVYQGFVGFYPTYLVEIKGLSPTLAASIFGVFFAAAIVIQPLTGFSKDMLGSKKTLSVVIGLFSIGLLLLPIVTGAVQLIGLTLILSFRTGSGVVINTYIAESLSPDMKGTGLGLLRTTWILIGTTAPILIGALGDYGFLEEGFLLLAMLSMVALIALKFVPDVTN